MTCYLEGQNVAVVLEEDLINLVFSRFHDGRPNIFRRITKGVAGAGPYDELHDPVPLGETGLVLRYDVRLVRPESGKYIDCHPVPSNPYELPVEPGEMLLDMRLEASLRVTPKDLAHGTRQDFELALGVVLAPSVAGQALRLVPRQVAVPGFGPEGLRQMAEEVLVELLTGALDELDVPMNFVLGAPLQATLSVGRLDVSDDSLRAHAGIQFT